jgi:hypothetical protein
MRCRVRTKWSMHSICGYMFRDRARCLSGLSGARASECRRFRSPPAVRTVHFRHFRTRGPSEPYVRADFQQAQSNRLNLCSCRLGARQRQTPQRLHQHVGRRRQIQPQLVGPLRLRAHAIRKQAHLLLYSGFQLTAGTVELFVQLTGRHSSA